MGSSARLAGRRRIGQGLVLEQPKSRGDEAAAAVGALDAERHRLVDPADDQAGKDAGLEVKEVTAGNHVIRQHPVIGWEIVRQVDSLVKDARADAAAPTRLPGLERATKKEDH